MNKKGGFLNLQLFGRDGFFSSKSKQDVDSLKKFSSALKNGDAELKDYMNKIKEISNSRVKSVKELKEFKNELLTQINNYKGKYPDDLKKILIRYLKYVIRESEKIKAQQIEEKKRKN